MSRVDISTKPLTMTQRYLIVEQLIVEHGATLKRSQSMKSKWRNEAVDHDASLLDRR
jgi:hypothetical protein